VLALLLAAILQNWSATIPEELRAFYAERQAIPKARLSVIFEHAGPDGAPRKSRELLQWDVEGNYLRRELGDEKGVIWPAAPGQPQEARLGPHRNTFIRNGDEVWNSPGAAVSASMRKGWQADKFKALDIRVADFSPRLGLYNDLDTAMHAPFVMQSNVADIDRVEYAVEDVGPLRKVTTRMAKGQDEGRIVRWFDPKRGMACVRAQLVAGDEVKLESRTRLRQTEIGWFPDEITYYSDGIFRNRIVIESAAFDDSVPDRMDYLKELNIDVGTRVDVKRDPEYGPSGSLRWTGEKLVTLSEFAASGLSEGPRRREGVERNRRENVARMPANDALFQLWDAYVHNAIERYKFDAGQVQKAYLILEESKNYARSTILTRGPEPYAALQAELREEIGRDPANKEKIAEIEAKMKKIRREVYSVFEDMLQPRIMRLPTRSQLHAAEQRSATRPASAPATQSTRPAAP